MVRSFTEAEVEPQADARWFPYPQWIHVQWIWNVHTDWSAIFVYCILIPMRVYFRKPGRWTPLEGMCFLENFQRDNWELLKHVRPVFLPNLLFKLLESLRLDRAYFFCGRKLRILPTNFCITASTFLVVHGFLRNTFVKSRAPNSTLQWFVMVCLCFSSWLVRGPMNPG